MNQKCPKSQKVESQFKNTPGTNCMPLRTNKKGGVTY